MPQFDGPFTIKSTNEIHSTVTLDLPNSPNMLPIFHTSKVKPFSEIDNDLFPHRALIPPTPITIDGYEEFFINKIVDKRLCYKKTQYKVCWQGEGPEGDLWLPAKELADCEALDVWTVQRSAGIFFSYVTLPVPAGSFSPTRF